MSTRNIERRLRYALNKAGFGLRKSRARNWYFYNQLGYMIVDIGRNFCVAGGNYDWTLEDVDEFVRTRCGN